MEERKLIENVKYTQERPLFGEKNLLVRNCEFDKGESPLKEVKNIEVEGGAFKWKYPLWYASDIKVTGTRFEEMSRAGIWYSNNLYVKDLEIIAPKEFRRCDGVTIKNVTFTNAEETLWNCNNVKLINVKAVGPYFAMGTNNLYIDGLELTGNYCFDGSKNVEVHNSKLLAKDCFWNCENVTVYDSYISGEYLAWNAKNVTFINCEIESLQGLCYVENLKMINCKFKNTSLAFEYSTVDVEITNTIDSVMNPISGHIKAAGIDKLIMDPNKVDINKTVIEAPIKETLKEFDGIIPD